MQPLFGLLPALISSGLLALLGWIAVPRLIATAVEKSVQHKLDERLEGIRSDLRKEEERLKAQIRAQETQLATLQSGALSTMAQRAMRLEARKMAAVEAVWKGVIDLGKMKSVASMSTSIRLDVLANESVGNSSRARTIQELAGVMLTPLGTETYTHDPSPDLHRPFLSEQVWSLFVAYRQVLARPVVVLMAAKYGQGAEILKEPTELIGLLKAAMPSYAEYLDKFGDAGLAYMVQPLEDRLHLMLVAELDGTVSDLMTVEQAQVISTKAAAIERQMQRGRMGDVPTGVASQGFAEE